MLKTLTALFDVHLHFKMANFSNYFKCIHYYYYYYYYSITWVPLYANILTRFAKLTSNHILKLQSTH